MSCAFFEVHAAPERRGSDYCGNKWRAPPDGFLRRGQDDGHAADLHCDDARRKTFSEPGDVRRPHAPPFDDFALTIQPHKAAAVLAKINSENCNPHLLSPAPSNRQPQ